MQTSADNFDLYAIRQQLEELSKLDRGRRVFGSDRHRYRLQRPVAPSELDRFEGRYGCVLPEDYRYFLSRISDGGAGPNYGLKPLAEAATGCDPSQPFLCTGEPFERQNGEFDRDICPGLIWLSDNGCASADNLVVNGLSRGRVWTVLEDRSYCCATTFYEWYTRWLTSAISTTRREPRIREVRVGMTLADVRDILGIEKVAPGYAAPPRGTYWLAFPNCNAHFEFSADDRVIQVNHHSHIIVPD